MTIRSAKILVSAIIFIGISISIGVMAWEIAAEAKSIWVGIAMFLISEGLATYMALELLSDFETDRKKQP